MDKNLIAKQILSSTHIGGIAHFKVTDKEYIEVADELSNLKMLQRLPNEYYNTFPIRYRILRKSAPKV